VFGCGAADSSVDPGDLALRDLLGISPEVAAGWDAGERARARAIIARASERAGDAPAEPVRLGPGTDERAAIIASMSAVDEQRRARGRDPVVVAWVLVEQQQVEVLPVAGERVHAAMASAGGAGTAERSALVLDGWEQATAAGWDELAQRQPGLLWSLARQAGHRDEPAPLPVIPAPQEPFVAIYVDAGARSFLAVNPVLLAAQEPGTDDGEGIAFARPDGPGRAPGPRAPVAVPVAAPVSGGAPGDAAPAGATAAVAASGNPYSFYGSINECAAFQRQRCQACAADPSCEAVTRDAGSVAAECEALSADGERGHYLLCINLALAMATVADCVDDHAQCPQVSDAGNQLSALTFNSVFLDDATCAGALDRCLAEIFGEPAEEFPGPGSPDPPPPPRETNLSCGDSSANCEFSPSCDSSCSVGSCDNAVSCGGCEGASCDGCESCESCNTGGGGGGGGGSSGCDDGGGSGEGGSSACDGSGCEGGGCDGGGCDGGCEGGGCDGGGCEGGTCSGGSDGCSSSCNVSRRQGSGQTALALLWVLAPCVFLEYRRRRERRRPARQEGAP
jgi:hypothetical protein